MEEIQLTPREVEVGLLVMAGRENKVAARLLGITEGTVAHHVSRCFVKTGAQNRTQLANWMRENKPVGVKMTNTGRPSRSKGRVE